MEWWLNAKHQIVVGKVDSADRYARLGDNATGGGKVGRLNVFGCDSKVLPDARRKLGDAQRAKIVRVLRLQGVLVGDRDFSTAASPTLKSLDPLTSLVRQEVRTAVITRQGDETDGERLQGGVFVVGWGVDVDDDDCCRLVANGWDLLPSVEDLVDLFSRVIEPAAWSPVTRSGYFAAWRCFVSFAVSQSSIGDVMPATGDLLRAFVSHLVMFNYAAGSVVSFLYAVKCRHVMYGHRFGISNVELARWVKSVRKLKQSEAKPKFPITAVHLKQVLALKHQSVISRRNATIVVTGTIMAARCAEVVALDVCDVRFGMDREMPTGVCVKIKFRKQDQCGKGLMCRIAPATKAGTGCPVGLLREYMLENELVVQPGCTKGEEPTKPCHACGRLFRSTCRMKGSDFRLRATTATNHGMTKNSVRVAIDQVLSGIGLDTAGYSGKSMRKGGLSQAANAGVPEELRTRQSGHLSVANRRYESYTPTQLYRFSQAFGF